MGPMYSHPVNNVTVYYLCIVWLHQKAIEKQWSLVLCIKLPQNKLANILILFKQHPSQFGKKVTI